MAENIEGTEPNRHKHNNTYDREALQPIVADHRFHTTRMTASQELMQSIRNRLMLIDSAYASTKTHADSSTASTTHREKPREQHQQNIARVNHCDKRTHQK